MRLAARMQKKRWNILPPQPGSVELAGQLGVSDIVAKILINRGIDTAAEAKSFLNPKLAELIEPELMPGIVPAIERIAKAIADKGKIVIYGDYDVDGITATSILLQVLAALKADVDFYIPHRIDEGYGLNPEAIKQLAEAGTNLIVTVDCGVTAFDSAKLVSQLGMDLIITDHHQPMDHMPEALAIVHPRLDKTYPEQNCAGVGVAFKLAWGLANKFKTNNKTDPALRRLLVNATVMAAMGTVADVVDIRGENRIITSFGLKAISDCDLPGIKALIESVGLVDKSIDSSNIAFSLAPLINAAGRMGHARLAVELLTSNSEVKSMRISQYLKQQNQQRRQLERKIFIQACEMVTRWGLDHPDKRAIILQSDSWHSGVIGIVASRIAEKFYRPTILINTSEGIGKGSGRSIEGFNLLNAIAAGSQYLVAFGGHAAAAGLTIELDKLGQFTEEFEKYARDNLDESQFESKLDIEAECSLGELSPSIVGELEKLGPFGKENPKPILATRGVRLASAPRKVGQRREHLQLAIRDNTSNARCIGFKMAHLEKKLLENEFFNVAYEPQIDTYNGSGNVQLVLNDIRFE